MALLARAVSVSTTVVNVVVALLFAAALVLQTIVDSPSGSLVAVVVAAVSFALRETINAVLWLRSGRARNQQPV